MHAFSENHILGFKRPLGQIFAQHNFFERHIFAQHTFAQLTPKITFLRLESLAGCPKGRNRMETTTGDITDVFYQKELEVIGVAGGRAELGKLLISNRGLVPLNSFNSGNRDSGGTEKC